MFTQETRSWKSLKGILVMVDGGLIVQKQNCHNVKPDILVGNRFFGKIRFCNFSYLRNFSFGNRLFGQTVFKTFARFHFNKNKKIFFSCNNIDLAFTVPVIAFNNLKTFFNKKRNGLFFPYVSFFFS